MLTNTKFFFSTLVFLMRSHSLRRHGLISFVHKTLGIVLTLAPYPASEEIRHDFHVCRPMYYFSVRIFKITVSESSATWALEQVKQEIFRVSSSVNSEGALLAQEKTLRFYQTPQDCCSILWCSD